MNGPLRALLALVTVAAAATATPGRAHHGVPSVSIAGAEGPGAALDTTSALPLPRGTAFALVKSEYVPFRRFAFAEPENKTHSSFSVLGAGYGITPWLSAYAFLPFAVKSQDSVGTSAGFGDPTLMVALALKYDRGVRLVPEKESLDDLADWHFSAWASTTLPGGSTSRRDDRGRYFEPEMQAGFGTASPAAGAAVLKQLSERITWLADASHQRFFAHDYPDVRYRFGAETRASTALTARLLGSGPVRADAIAELSGLHLARDRERNDAGEMEALESSGGEILYAGAGVRLSRGPLSFALGAKRAVLKDLNEAAGQQGSEGLEHLRAAASLSWTTAL